MRSSASSPRLLPKDPTGRRRLHALNLAGSPATPPVVCTPPQEQHLQNEVTVAGGGQKVLQLERPLPLHVGNENNDGDDWVVTEDEHDLSFSSLVASDVLPITPPMAAQIVPVTSPSGGRSPFNMLVNDRTQETFI